MKVLRSINATALTMLVCAGYAATAGPPPDPGTAVWELGGDGDWPRWQPLPVLRGHDYALSVLTEGLGHSDALVRARCAFLIGQIGSPESIPGLVACLNDPDRKVRMFSGIALGLLGEERGVAATRAALTGTRWWVRYYAVISLWHLGGERARAALRSALRDPDDLVRAAAQGALGEAAQPATTEREVFEVDEPLSLEEFIVLAGDYLVVESDWWFHLGDYQQALRCQEAGIFLEPTFVELFEVGGWLYWSLGRNTEAVGTYRRGIEANPASWEVFWALGFHFFNIGRCEDSLPYLARACELGAPPVWAHTYAHALERTGRLEDSLRQWERLQSLEPDSPIPSNHVERLRGMIQ